MSKNIKKILGGTALATLLSACGGGGGGTPAPVTDSPLAGAWAGTSTSGNTLEALILENGQIWAIGGTLSNGMLLVSGVVSGSLQTSGNTLSSSDIRTYSLVTGTSITGTLAGTFTTGSSISFTATPQTGSAQSVSLAPVPTANYDYNTPATLAAISGSWPGTFSNSSGTVVVNANGTFSATTAGCNMSGTLAPRASGKNVYDVAVNFGPAPCGIPNGSATGNAVISKLNTGGRQLMVLVRTADSSNAGVFFGQQ